MNTWTYELFKVEKPIIGMCHLQALPGDPKYDEIKGMDYVVKKAREDLLALQGGGIDGVLFSNEFSLPYLTNVNPVTIAAMGRVIGELMVDITVPYGVDVLWDPYKTFDLAVSVDAKFVREIFTGVYASDFGLWNTNYGEVIRHKHSIGAKNIKALFNIVPEAAKYLADRDIESIAKSTVFNNNPDALCVSGLIAGAETDTEILRRVKNAVPNTVIFVNTGVSINNVEKQLQIADGCVIGTHFKKDGQFYNGVDIERVERFMRKVKQIR